MRQHSNFLFIVQILAATGCAVSLVRVLSLPTGQISPAIVLVLLVFIAINGYSAAKETIFRIRGGKVTDITGR